MSITNDTDSLLETLSGQRSKALPAAVRGEAAILLHAA